MQRISPAHGSRGAPVPVAGTSMMRNSTMRGTTMAAAGDVMWGRASAEAVLRIGSAACPWQQGGGHRPRQRATALPQAASAVLSPAHRFAAAAQPSTCWGSGRRPMTQLRALPREPPSTLKLLCDRSYTACWGAGRRRMQLRALPPVEPMTLVEILRDRSYTAPAHIARRQVSEGE